MEEALVLTPRLALRRPALADAGRIFERWASDRDALRFVSWPAHRTIEDSRAFVALSDQEWERSPCGPCLIEERESGRLLGSTGLAFAGATEAMTGYVLARDAWGRGIASEALRAMIDLARRLGVERLTAHCHADHRVSRRVLEKAGFERSGMLRAARLFPNLDTEAPQDVVLYTFRRS